MLYREQLKKNASLVSGRENVCEDLCMGTFASGGLGSAEGRLGEDRKGEHGEGRMRRVTWELKMGVVCQMNGKARCAAAYPLPLRHRDSAILEGRESFH